MVKEEEKKIVVVENENAKEVFEEFKNQDKVAVIDFTNSLVVFPNSLVVCKKFKESKVENAFAQLKRWVSSEAFNQIFILGGLDLFTKDLVFDWLFDHKKNESFPNLIVSGKKRPLFWDSLSN